MLRVLSPIAVVLAAAAIVCAGLSGCSDQSAPAPSAALQTVSEAQPATSGPRIEFEETAHDFGVVTTSVDRVSHGFIFWNRGNEELVISDVRASGRPTAFEPIRIAPGERGVIPVSFRPKGRSGHQAKSFRVESNDPENRVVILRISADVFTQFDIEPKIFRFDQIEAGYAKTITGRVRIRGEDLEVTGIEVNGAYASARIVGTKKIEVAGMPAKLTTVEISIHEDAPLGWIDRKVIIRTNNPEQPAMDVPLWANVIGPIEIQPAKLPLGVVRQGVPFKRSLRLVSRDGSPFRLDGATFDSEIDGFEMSIDPAQAQTQEGADILVLDVSGSGPAQNGNLEGVITLQLSAIENSDQAWSVNVPFHCVVRSTK